MEHLSHDFLSTPEGLAHRFNRPPVHYPHRVLRFRGDMVPGEGGAPPTYTNVEYEVEFNPEPGKPATGSRWMPIQEWRELVGVPCS